MSVFLKAKIFACAAGIFLSVLSQAQTLVDPGISSHNYKMPNKAKMSEISTNQILLTKRSFRRSVIAAHQTPKYASMPATIISKREKQQFNVINPLQSVANYKAQTVVKPVEKTQAMMTCSL